MTTRGHEYPQPCTKLISHPKNQREQPSRAPSPQEEREVGALPHVGPGVSLLGRQVWVSGEWLISMLRQRLLQRRVSAGNQEGFDLLCVARSNWASELSEMRKKKYPRYQ